MPSRLRKKGAVASDPYAVALRLMRARSPEFARIASLLRTASESGDRRADYALGTWYLHGRHLPKSIRIGTRLIARAARAGVPDAMFDYAVSLEKGTGVARNERKAALWFLAAALSGMTRASFEVGRHLYHGIGFPKDRAQSRVWLDFAAGRLTGYSNKVDAQFGTGEKPRSATRQKSDTHGPPSR